MDVLGNGKIQNSFRKLRYNSSMDERRGQGGKHGDVVTKVSGDSDHNCDSLQRVNNVFTGRRYLSSDIYSSLGGVSRENSGIRTRVGEVSFSVRGLFVVTLGDLEPFLSHIIETTQL